MLVAELEVELVVECDAACVAELEVTSVATA
jgi:hypothetical protein